jgi:hypothetical protein
MMVRSRDVLNDFPIFHKRNRSWWRRWWYESNRWWRRWLWNRKDFMALFNDSTGLRTTTGHFGFWTNEICC